ncbi:MULTISPECIES: GIY-YIG nuclease family protein [unclassified Nocardioides]|uniref:GIY-YIG nuclease family protein n=1 Tax=unclassified Nocardioides TaxID=2615069 RepID=UPI003015542A
MAYTYMLLCSDGSFYVGSTRDLEHRLYEHQIGEGAAYTRRRLPVQLVWHEEHENVGAAFHREKQVQNWSRVKRFALIRQDYAGLPALAKKDFSPRRDRSDETG